MSAYTDADFALVPSPEGYRATVDLKWEIGTKHSGLWFVVPASYPSDGPSIPWWARWAFNPADPRYQKAARLHDWALEKGWTAWTSTSLFYDALKADDVGRLARWAMSLAVLLRQAAKGR